MDSNWGSVPSEVRFGIRYLSAHFYPRKYMSRWGVLKPLSVKFVGKVMGYSPQQYQEELQHFDFFERYFKGEPLDLELPESYIRFFDNLTEDFKSGDVQRIVTRFHMVTEGVLATTGLHLLREAGERYGLKEFTAGIRRIVEDEARHINFGLSLVTDREYAVKRIEELYPEALQIVLDGKETLSSLAPFEEILGMMEELKRARLAKVMS
ncbi:hypothetical protein GWK48_00505 [Metallosphaera tengchongensis]|uniref:Ferritin-like domain-containing protein n=1 Tax=Metallosphaera tengchongensis TaxID=1532350 RepID=A0A6N0NSK1_9CREN|nr:hypothetical protein [Metallosphaera tengchongensis]QKQ99076.1 hypothetical protein GWK48_00505 [Metallosphaera tengchongensis]